MHWQHRHMFDELHQCVRLSFDVLRQGGNYDTRIPGVNKSVGKLLSDTMEKADRMIADLDKPTGKR